MDHELVIARNIPLGLVSRCMRRIAHQVGSAALMRVRRRDKGRDKDPVRGESRLCLHAGHMVLRLLSDIVRKTKANAAVHAHITVSIATEFGLVATGTDIHEPTIEHIIKSVIPRALFPSLSLISWSTRPRRRQRLVHYILRWRITHIGIYRRGYSSRTTHTCWQTLLSIEPGHLSVRNSV